MEKKHRCKLCFRNFANGRALGGHMRSHMIKFHAEDKAASKQEISGEIDHDFQSSYSPASSSSSSSEEEYDEEEERRLPSYVLRENPKRSAVMADRDDEFSSGESETESSKIWRRSSEKRVRETRISDFDVFVEEKKARLENEQSSPVSSISDTTPEEHVAHCLIMLSRDTWRKECDEEELEVEEEESSKKMAVSNKFRGKYRCEECDKLFRSYQALGGHRASHKKIKVTTAAAPPRTAAEKSGGVRVHQCPFCDRVFSSGQALGGHKRSHFIGAAAISTSIDRNSPRISQVLSIDLNLPAPVEDDEVAISAVSDAEFVCSVKQ